MRRQGGPRGNRQLSVTPIIDNTPSATPGRRVPGTLSTDEGADISEDGESPVAETYGVAAP